MVATEPCRGIGSFPAVLLACRTLLCSAHLAASQEPEPEASGHQQCFDIGYTTLARSGLSYGDNDEYGRLIDFGGLPIGGQCLLTMISQNCCPVRMFKGGNFGPATPV